MPKRYTDQERVDAFWSKIDATGDCWIWTGNVDRQGYGRVKINGRTVLVHRHAWSLLVGPIKKGRQIDHLCRNRRCVNVGSHLQPVTARENLRRGYSSAHDGVRRGQCRRGHPYSADNTMVTKQGHRRCRICARKYNREWSRRKAAA